MPSLSSRTVEMPANWTREPQGARANPQPVQSFPNPAPVYIQRTPFLASSIPAIAATQDAALRQFYGGRILPARRVSQT